MSVWDDITKPVNNALNSTAFKVAFPVQALAQGATKLATGLDPAEQYAAGAAGGSLLAGGAAIAGSGAATAPPATAATVPATTTATPAASAPASSNASAWENHAPQTRYSSMPMSPGGSGYNSQKQQSPTPMPPYPVMRPNTY